MIPPNIQNLIKALLKKTLDKKATWGKTSRPNEFKLLFEKGAVTTDYWSTDDNEETVDIGIYNSFGDRIDNIYLSKGEDGFDLLNELHQAAKREFYKVDETITGLFDEVQSDKTVGKRIIENNDDLPF
jgi:hypothetical protein